MKTFARISLSVLAGAAFCVFMSLFIRLIGIPDVSWLPPLEEALKELFLKIPGVSDLPLIPVVAPDPGTDNVYAVLLNLFVAPVFEGFVFHFFLFRKLKAKMNVFVAAIFVSVLFALFHLNPANMVYAFFIGLLLIAAEEACGNWLYGCVVHFGANLAAWVIDRDPHVVAFFFENWMIMVPVAGIVFAFVVLMLREIAEAEKEELPKVFRWKLRKKKNQKRFRDAAVVPAENPEKTEADCSGSGK